MRTPILLLTVALIVHGKFVKIENLHLKEVNEEGIKHNWNSDSMIRNKSTTMPRGTALGGGAAQSFLYHTDDAPLTSGKAKLLHSVNEMNLDRDIMASDATSLKKEWKSFYYPNPYQHSSHGLSNGIPFAWSNGVINNNNLLNVGGGYPPVGATGVPGDLGMGYKPLLGTTNTLQCLLFGVVGLVTFLLNSVMALVLSVKLPGLEGLLGGLLGGVGLGGLGALTKQEVVDTKGKHMEYIHFPDRNHGHGGGGSGNGGSVDNTLQSVDNSEYFDKNR